MGRGSVTVWNQIKGFSGFKSKSGNDHIVGHPLQQTSVFQSLKGRNRWVLETNCVEFSRCNCFRHQYSKIPASNNKRSNVGSTLETYKVNKKIVVNDGNISTPDYTKPWLTWKSELFRRNLTKEYISKLSYAVKNGEGSTETIKRIFDQEASVLDTPRTSIFMDLLESLQPSPQLALEVAAFPEDVGTTGALQTVAHHLKADNFCFGAFFFLCARLMLPDLYYLVSRGGKDKAKNPGLVNSIGLDFTGQILLL